MPVHTTPATPDLTNFSKAIRSHADRLSGQAMAQITVVSLLLEKGMINEEELIAQRNKIVSDFLTVQPQELALPIVQAMDHIFHNAIARAKLSQDELK